MKLQNNYGKISVKLVRSVFSSKKLEGSLMQNQVKCVIILEGIQRMSN